MPDSMTESFFEALRQRGVVELEYPQDLLVVESSEVAVPDSNIRVLVTQRLLSDDDCLLIER